ncbi:MAG: TadE/TadG family type IV pilus assembly protein [Alphaproteobacteria bacterium]
MTRSLISLGKKQDGVAAIEFALVAPILMLLFLGVVEITRFVIISQKTEKAALTMSDLVAQSKEISTDDLDILIQAAGEVMKPLEFNDTGYVIVSSVSRVGSNAATVNWQYTGGGTWTHSSQIGFQGSAATLPAGFELDPNEGIIIAEVYFSFMPLFTDMILPTNTIYRVGVYKPRLGELTSLGA